EADHAWLSAYTHMLSGFGNLFLAFDPTDVLRDLAAGREALKSAPELPAYYDQAALEAEIAALEAEESAMQAKMEALENKISEIREQTHALADQIKAATDDAQKQALTAKKAALQDEISAHSKVSSDLWGDQRMVRNEIRAAKSKMPEGMEWREPLGAEAEIEAIYVILSALRQQPDKARIKAAGDAWANMIAQNRLFWAALAAETDNDREWIPNPSQTSALPLTIAPRVAEAWQKILLDAEAVLEGKLLIPHMLLPAGHGIDLSAYIADPSPIDFIDWFHGKGAYRYVAKGPKITAQSWNAFERLTGGNAGGFALFFN
ncbi:MAG: hypothetical protein WBC90_16170, partial [Albidovulum sp.]